MIIYLEIKRMAKKHKPYCSSARLRSGWRHTSSTFRFYYKVRELIQVCRLVVSLAKTSLRVKPLQAGQK